jgi:hypothetical protein
MNAHLQRIYAASNGTHVAMSTSDQFADMIARCAILTGLPVPRAEAIFLMHGIITDHFMWATVEDIELAVKLNITRSFHTFTEAYGELSGAYLSNILRCYETERGKAIQLYRKQEERKELPPREITDAEWMAMVSDHHAWMMAGNDNWKMIAARMVTFLWESGRCNDNTFRPEEWKHIRAAARKNIMERQKIGEKAVERMNVTQRERFDGDCLMELRAVVYGLYLRNIYKTN